LEANKRAGYTPSITASASAPGRNHRPHQLYSASLPDSLGAELNTFFPFDPYNLPTSSRYIQGVYREWSSVAIDDGDDDDEDEDEDASDAEEQVNPPPSPGSSIPIARNTTTTDDDGLGASFEVMSISPAGLKDVVSTSS
jgi:RNA polymerase I-specific transcription initiation factor RRN3